MSATAPPLLAALDAAGLLDATWRLPLGAGTPPGRDNIIHHTAVAIALEKSRLDRIDHWGRQVSIFLNATQVPGCPGLYYREPDNRNPNSWDNLIGTCATSAMLDYSYGYYAEQVYQWGLRHGFCYNVEAPESYSPHHDYNRFIGAPAFIKMAAGKRVWLSQWDMAQAIEASLEPHNPDKTDVGNKLLMWLWKSALRGRSRYLDSWWAWWEREMGKQYPGGLEEFMRYYFKPISTSWQVTLATGQITEATKEHPFVTYSRGRSF